MCVCVCVKRVGLLGRAALRDDIIAALIEILLLRVKELLFRLNSV